MRLLRAPFSQVGRRTCNLQGMELLLFRSPAWLRRALYLLALSFAVAAAAENWPCWRGPRLDGTSHEKDVPVYWSATSNVLWRADLPGLGHASPIVCGDRVFTVSALPEAQERLLLCLDRQTGKTLWQQTVLTASRE